MNRSSARGCATPTLPSCAPRCGRRRARLRAEAADLDARTEAEACDLADELQEAPLGGVWPETLAVLREADPEGAEALATAADAFDRAIERAPDPESEPEPPPDPLAGLPPMARVEALGRLLKAATAPRADG